MKTGRPTKSKAAKPKAPEPKNAAMEGGSFGHEGVKPMGKPAEPEGKGDVMTHGHPSISGSKRINSGVILAISDIGRYRPISQGSNARRPPDQVQARVR